MLTKVYFHLDDFQRSGNDNNCHGDNCDGDVERDDDDDDDGDNDSDDGDGGDAPGNIYYSKEGGKATGMCLTNGFYFAVGMFSIRSQTTTKCGKKHH